LRGSATRRRRRSSGSADDAAERGPPRSGSGRWHTVECVKTDTAIALVIDGQTFAENGAVGAIANTEPVEIGSHGGTAEFFRRALDEVSVVVR
jgi:hypothetical protein